MGLELLPLCYLSCFLPPCRGAVPLGVRAGTGTSGLAVGLSVRVPPSRSAQEQ